jgi:GAF domain-containing protein
MTTAIEHFPFPSVLDLSLLIDFWRRVAEDVASPWHELGRTIVQRVAEAPELRGPVPDLSVLEPHHDLVHLMMTAIVPPALREEVYAAAVAPWNMTPIFQTSAAQRIDFVNRLRDHMRTTFGDELWYLGMTTKAYNHVLETFYGADAGFDFPFSLPVQHAETGLESHLAFEFDNRFITIEPQGTLPPLPDEDRRRLVAEPLNIPLWTETLPPQGFLFRGVAVVTAADVTDQVLLSLMRDDLLKKDAMTSRESVQHLQKRIRDFMRKPDLELGFIGIERGEDVEAITGARPVGRSLLLSSQGAPTCPHKADSYYARALDRREPVIVYDLECCDVCTGFEKHLLGMELRNLLVFPLHYGDELVGLLELASPNPGDLNAINALKLVKIEMLFATAMRRSLEELEDRVQAAIKQNYTAIHPSVEWRFEQAAANYIHAQEGGAPVQPEEIVFQGVRPLYGLSDIRSSSDRRNASIQADLIEQLRLGQRVIGEAGHQRSLPILGEIAFRLQRYAETVSQGLRTDDETSVLEYLQGELEPLFDQLAGFGGGVPEAVSAYREALDPNLGIVYRQRKDFEESVAAINKAITSTIEAEQGQAQAMLPHYFEMFRTDGVDYNIYVGAALLEGGRYDPMYLRNLRLWQLMLMCRIEWALRASRPGLSTPLEVGHLILVQDTPLAIRFRADERRFDVDGAYNIRYEIVKKRIDKATVKDGGERLTQPGKIAIGYSTDREALEYRRYIEYLRAVGYLEGPVEDLELEELQGVFGLRALRVTVAERATEDRSAEVTAESITSAVRDLTPEAV